MAKGSGINGHGDKFPQTRWSAIVAARSDDESERARALEVLIGAYWKPVYKYVRIKWAKSGEDAQDLTQGFFTKAIEKDFFHGYDPAKARFRTFLRTCIDGYVANEHKAARRMKRGGAVQIESLDFASAEGELALAALPSESPDDYFEKEWARSFLSMTLDLLRNELRSGNREVHLKLFERYYLTGETVNDEVSYNSLAEEFSLSVTSVTNYLALARREFRRIALERLKEITATEEEFRREARSLLGVDSV